MPEHENVRHWKKILSWLSSHDLYWEKKIDKRKRSIFVVFWQTGVVEKSLIRFTDELDFCLDNFTSFLCITQIRQRFVNSSLKQRAITAHTYEFRRDFGQVLSSQMVRGYYWKKYFSKLHCFATISLSLLCALFK